MNEIAKLLALLADGSVSAALAAVPQLRDNVNKIADDAIATANAAIVTANAVKKLMADAAPLVAAAAKMKSMQ